MSRVEREAVVFRSRWNCFHCILFIWWLPFICPFLSCLICYTIGFGMITPDLLVATVLPLLVQLLLSAAFSGQFVLTDRNLHAYYTIFLGFRLSYPLENIQEASVSEVRFPLRLGSFSLYLCRIRCGDTTYTNRFACLSRKSVDMLKGVRSHREAAPSVKPNLRFVPSLWCLGTVVCTLCPLYMLFLCFFVRS